MPYTDFTQFMRKRAATPQVTQSGRTLNPVSGLQNPDGTPYEGAGAGARPAKAPGVTLGGYDGIEFKPAVDGTISDTIDEYNRNRERDSRNRENVERARMLQLGEDAPVGYAPGLEQEMVQELAGMAAPHRSEDNAEKYLKSIYKGDDLDMGHKAWWSPFVFWRKKDAMDTQTREEYERLRRLDESNRNANQRDMRKLREGNYEWLHGGRIATPDYDPEFGLPERVVGEDGRVYDSRPDFRRKLDEDRATRPQQQDQQDQRQQPPQMPSAAPAPPPGFVPYVPYGTQNMPQGGALPDPYGVWQNFDSPAPYGTQGMPQGGASSKPVAAGPWQKFDAIGTTPRPAVPPQATGPAPMSQQPPQQQTPQQQQQTTQQQAPQQQVPANEGPGMFTQRKAVAYMQQTYDKNLREMLGSTSVPMNEALNMRDVISRVAPSLVAQSQTGKSGGDVIREIRRMPMDQNGTTLDDYMLHTDAGRSALRMIQRAVQQSSGRTINDDQAYMTMLRMLTHGMQMPSGFRPTQYGDYAGYRR